MFLFVMSAKLTLFVLILLPLSGLIIGRIGRTLRATSFKGQKRLGMIMSHVEEGLAGLRIIKAFNAEDKMDLKFNDSRFQNCLGSSYTCSIIPEGMKILIGVPRILIFTNRNPLKIFCCLR